MKKFSLFYSPLFEVKYQKAEQSETKEERKQRKYRYLYQVYNHIFAPPPNLVERLRGGYGN